MTSRITAIVLAAGVGRRFGGDKLSASIDGRPMLQHVLDVLAGAGIPDPVVVLGPDAASLRASIDWRTAGRVHNPEPGRGLSSSLRVGWQAAFAGAPPPDAVIVVLGDQPLLGVGAVRALIDAPLDQDHPIVVARHADGARNPVRLEPAAATLVDAATGDRGLGPLIDARADLVRWIDVSSANPDVDEPADLVRLLLDRWSARVRANAEQVERVRDAPDEVDFYAPVTRMFVADPDRTDDRVLDALIALARPTDTWLDVGAGAGRYALPLARRVREVLAVDPSSSMLEGLRRGMEEHGIHNIVPLEGRFPPEAELRTRLGPGPVADVVLMAHVSYDVADIGPFLDAVEGASRRLCVAVLMDPGPATVAAPFWPPVHGEERVLLPALTQFVELLGARGALPAVQRVAGERRRWQDRDELLMFLRRQVWTTPGSPADARLVEALKVHARTAGDGSVEVAGAEPLDIGIVTWRPPQSR